MADFGGERFDPTVSESKDDSNEQEKVSRTSELSEQVCMLKNF